jgi:serine/threonine protein kinase
MEKTYTNFTEFSKDYRYDEETDKIGEGGFASVYRADDMIRQREVAVKVSKVRKDERYSLKHEFEVVKSFPIHPNIAYYESCNRFKIAGVGLYDLAVMDYYPLGNLEVFIQNQLLNEEQKHQIIEGILSAIDFLHNNDAIHRDIKPSNILIAKFANKYIPKIADFGLGKVMQVSEGQSSIENSFIGGSINYAAPEQILGTKIRPNVDLWSFGVLLFKVLVGELPFIIDESTTSTSVRRERLIKKIVNAQIPDKINEIAEPYQSIIRKCLVVDSELRVKSAKELLQILNFDRDLEEAQKLFEKKEIDEALTKYEELLAVNPSNETIKMRISDIKKYQSSSTKIEAIERLVLNKDYKAAIESAKDLNTDEIKQAESIINVAHQWLQKEDRANQDFKNESYQNALIAFEELEKNTVNKFSNVIDDCKKILSGNSLFEQAEKLNIEKKYNEVAILFSKIEKIAPSKQHLLDEKFKFINTFLNLQSEASSFKNQKKWKLALGKFKELAELTGDVTYEQEIINCEDELNKTIIIKPTPNKNDSNDDSKTVIIQKEDNKKSIQKDDNRTTIIQKEDKKEEKTIISDSKPQLENRDSTPNTPPTLKKNSSMIYIIVGVMVVVLFGLYFALKKEDSPTPPPIVTQTEKEKIDPNIINNEMASAKAKFMNAEYKEYADIIINLRNTYGVDSLQTSSQKLADKLKDLEGDINKDEVMTSIAKKICTQSLRLDTNNKTANDIKRKYNF